MTRDEFKILVKGMKAAYTTPSFIPDKDAFEIWYGLLSDIPYEVASAATKSYMMTETKIPAPADIRNKAMMLSKNNDLKEIEAWTLVRKALRHDYEQAEKEFNKLPELVQKAVGNPSQLCLWATSDIKSVETVIASNFMRTYQIEVKRAEEYARLPEDVKALMQKISPLNRIEQMGEQLCQK